MKESKVETTNVKTHVNFIDKATLDNETKELVNETEQTIKKIENLQKTLE